MASGKTPRPSEDSRSCPGGAQGEAEELAEGRPLRVPGTVGAFVVEGRGGEVQLGGLPGCLECGAADQHGEHGVLFLRHGRGPAPAGGAQPGELGHFRPAQEQDVGGDLAGGVGHGGEGVAQRGDGEPVGVPRRRHGRQGRVRRPAGRTGRRASPRCPGRSAGCRPRGFLPLRRSAPAGRGDSSRRAAAARPANHCAALSPNVNGSECWVRLRPTHSVSVCCSARAESADVVAFRSLRESAERVPGQQHQGGVEDVLAGQRGVHGLAGADACGVERPDLPRGARPGSGMTGLAPPRARTAMSATS